MENSKIEKIIIKNKTEKVIWRVNYIIASNFVKPKYTAFLHTPCKRKTV